MAYNLVSNVESCYIDIPQLLYYSHLPSIIVSLFFGVFVFMKNRKLLAGKVLLAISLSFSAWAIVNLIVWLTFSSVVFSFFWSFFEILSVLFYFLVFYFVFVFIEERDIPFTVKIVFGILFLPVALISPTKYYFTKFSAITCDAVENHDFLYYIYALKAAVFIGVLVLLIVKFLKYREIAEKRTKIVIVGIGTVLLLLSFLITQYSSNLIFDDYRIEFYGLFAITIFMGVLAYLIVKYKAFDIKLIGAQALVYSLVILIGSQFFFIQNNTNRILAGMTLIIASGFGYFLIKTVKLDLQRKDELQRMADALAVSNDRLKKADNAKTEFISIASHQLRTPLTVIKGYVSLLTEGTFGDVSEDVKRVVKNIKISNDRLIELVEDLLNISRMESGRMEFKFAPTDVPELCTELYNSFGARDKENHDIEFKLDLPEEGIRKISTDRSKLREVISNLIDNAVKYTPQGWVRIKAFQKNKMIVRIEISDSGIGIPETEMPYLFAKFSRGKDTGRLTAPGTGLGLHVSRSMVEALHGRVWAESEGDKKGSTFIIELPAGDEETGDDVENVRTEMPRLDTLEKALPATPRRMEVPEPVANEPTSQAEAPQEEKPVPAVTEVSVTEKPRTEPAPEGRIIFSEPKKRNRIV